MKILLIEDCKEKINAIEKCIESNLEDTPFEITKADSLELARRKIIGESFDLVIFDIYLPLTSCNKFSEQDISFDLIEEFSESKNYQAESIAITKYDTKEIKNTSLFNDAGVTVVHYSEDKRWEAALSNKLMRIKDNVKYDFIIFCALEKEREAYKKTNAIIGERKIIKGLNCQKIEISNFSGLCITPKKAGLVEMAIISAKAIEAFSPPIVAMSGICAGVEGESKLLDLVVGKLCWEYQTGKFKNNKFIQEPYQVTIDSDLETELDQFVLEDDLEEDLKKNLYATELSKSKIMLAPISSGSAVIADNERMQEIVGQQRKMAALEMEMYALYEAARQSLIKPLYFGVKSVVDLGDQYKGDNVHTEGATLSARFVVRFLEKKLPKLVS